VRDNDDYENHISYPEDSQRQGIGNFTWTVTAIKDWETIWNTLWKLGYKWEWQNADRYARPFGATYKLFGCYNDAEKLDMAVPLPQIHVIEEVRELLLDNPANDPRLNHSVGDIDRWLKEHYAP
jgi:hypothetical protein|tara:strand:+ start:3436 stop:3807 length:372 start_codon:yes stop_codon:yes gene_type:complete